MRRHAQRALLLSALAAVAAVAALAGPALASRGHASATAITVTATEFRFKLSKTSVKAGQVVFTLVNKGHIAHDFKIAGKKTPLVGPGKSAKLSVKLKAGHLPYVCTVPGHAQAGMKGTLTVK